MMCVLVAATIDGHARKTLRWSVIANQDREEYVGRAKAARADRSTLSAQINLSALRANDSRYDRVVRRSWDNLFNPRMYYTQHTINPYKSKKTQAAPLGRLHANMHDVDMMYRTKYTRHARKDARAKNVSSNHVICNNGSNPASSTQQQQRQQHTQHIYTIRHTPVDHDEGKHKHRLAVHVYCICYFYNQSFCVRAHASWC